MTAGVAVALAAALGALYFVVDSRRAPRPAGDTKAGIGFEKPTTNDPKAIAEANLTRHLEATGVRMFEEDKRPRARLLVVNHSGADLSDLKGTVEIVKKDDNAIVATLPFVIPAIRAFEAKEIEGFVDTKLRAYELPDWQFVTCRMTFKTK